MRELNDIITHIRSVCANPAVKTTLIQTEDLIALCDAAETDAVAPNPPVESDVREALDLLQLQQRARARAFRIMDAARDVSDPITLAQADAYEECGNELKAALSALRTQQEPMRCAECDCDNPPDGCTWIASPSLDDVRRNEIIEECAKVADGFVGESWWFAPRIADAIRTLSQKNGTTTDRSEG